MAIEVGIAGRGTEGVIDDRTDNVFELDILCGIDDLTVDVILNVDIFF
jgi:hypothetical protein